MRLLRGSMTGENPRGGFEAARAVSTEGHIGASRPKSYPRLIEQAEPLLSYRIGRLGKDSMNAEIQTNKDVTLRRATSADASAIRDLTRAAYAKWISVIGRPPKPMDADYEAAVSNHLIDLLHSSGGLVALIEMIPEADHLLIENVAVSPECRGQGYGRKLMDHAEKLATTLGFTETRLYTNKLFAENVQLYRKLGYRIDREEAFKDGFIVHMSKPL
jgi:ribosomal protein S18 acetylase RimI-like enzyme